MSGAGDDTGLSGPDEIDALAGEYVLGVLDAEQARGVRVRARGDAALAQAIVGWEIRLLPMAAGVQPRDPPGALWHRIEARIAVPPEEPANDAPLASQPAIAPAYAAGPAARRPGPPRARGVRGWQAATVLGFALAAAFAGIAFLPSATPAGVQLAAIAPVGAPQAAFVASARPDGTVVLTALSPADVPSGRDLELWILPPGEKTVAPLGVLPVTGRTLRLQSAPATGTQLLISLEPRGGSPTGQPTGPVLYSGTLASA